MAVDERNILQLALEGRLNEEQAVEYINNACGDDRELASEIIQRLASASVMGRDVRVAGNLLEWLKQKCSGNTALKAGIIALMLSNGMLSAYEVQKGDTLWKLGGGTGAGVQQLLYLNPSVSADTVLKPGMKLALPSEKKNDATEKKDAVKGNTYIVEKGDTFSGIAKKFGLKLEELKALNPQIQNYDRLGIGQKLNVEKKQQAVQTKTDPKTDYVARVIYAESGNSIDEMEMIAHLIVNRMKSGIFPSDAYSVVTQRRQFSCTSGSDGNVKWQNYSRNLNKATKKCYELAEKVMKGDSSGMKGEDGATFYCTKSLAKKGVGIDEGAEGLSGQYGHPEAWGEYSTFTPVCTSANHVFYKCDQS